MRQASPWYLVAVFALFVAAIGIIVSFWTKGNSHQPQAIGAPGSYIPIHLTGDMRSSDLSGVDARNANVRGVHLDGAHLAFADLSDADLTDSTLSRSILSGAKLE